MLETLSTVASHVFSIYGLALMFLGSLIGVTVGALPGLSATMAVAVLVPITFNMPTDYAMMMLLGVYGGAMFGGSISAILVNVPGTPAAVMTSLDGYPMAQRGEGSRAIGFAIVASFFGGIFSSIVCLAAAPLLALVALKFAAPEYFALAVFGLTGVATGTSKGSFKGIAAVFLGLFIALIGLDPMTGVDRFSFDNPELMSGVSFIPVMIGLYGVGEILIQIHKGKYGEIRAQQIKGTLPTWKEIKNLKGLLLRSSIMGTSIGALPGEGATVASFLAYNDARQMSKHPEKFGTGIPEGIVSCESANNSVVGGSLIPTLTLGIPGSGTMAVLMGAFMMHNIMPGPMLFKDHPALVYAIFISLFVNNFFMLFIGLFGARFFARLVTISQPMLMPIIVVLCIIGSFAISNTLFNVVVMVIMGIIGYFMRLLDIPIAPAVLGVVLGPLAEVSLRRSLLMSKGSLAIFIERPGSLIVLILTVIYLCWPYISKKLFAKPVEDNVQI